MKRRSVILFSRHSGADRLGVFAATDPAKRGRHNSVISVNSTGDSQAFARYNAPMKTAKLFAGFAVKDL
jgi:hypothetical protein